MNEVRLIIDGREITAGAGDTVLYAALQHGIYIPNLCAIAEKEEPSASCRLCFVEVAGKKSPVTACTETVSDGMTVFTRGEKALQLTRAGFELLMASHALDCAHCPKNGVCELQKIARHLYVTLKPRRLRLLTRELPVDDSNPLFTYNPNKCVLCGRCVWICREKMNNRFLGFAYRGFNRRVTTFANEPMVKLQCAACVKCINVCPTGALSLKNGVK